MLRRVVAVVLAVVSLAACATVRPPAPIARAPARSEVASRPAFPTPAPLYIPPPSRSPETFAVLPGWAEDDHATAFAAFVAGCRAARDPALAETCQEAAVQGPLGETDARQFFETHFRPERLAATGLLTAYFTPIYEARRQREGEFTEPVRPRPADLPRSATGAGAYADRAEIDRRPASDALAWMRPEDLLFLQIQGSGVLTLPDGERWRAAFDGANGAPFVGLAAPMRRLGLLDQDTSGERIRAWLADHRGAEAQSVIEMDPRYVFFRMETDDGAEPAGAAGFRLVPGRALAVDPALHGMGEVLWVDACAPNLPGAFPRYRRLAMALDTGSAIKGGARADLYLGRGPDAGLEAGRVRHLLTLYRLVPIAFAPDRLAALIPPGP